MDLRHYAWRGDLVGVKKCVLNGTDVNCKDQWERTPLHEAAANGHLPIVEYLVSQKADMHIKDNWVQVHYGDIRTGHTMDPRFKNMEFLKERKDEIYGNLAMSLSNQPIRVKKEQTDDEPESENQEPALPALLHTEEKEPDPNNNNGDDDEQPLSQNDGLASVFGDVVVVKVETISPLKRASDEIEIYKNENSIPLINNPLEWWKDNQYKFPLLSNHVKNILCTPATSVPSERVFSTAGDIVSSQRANIKSENVDMLIFLKKKN